LGYTQLERSLLQRAQIKMIDDDRKRFRQHPGLTQHLLRKCQVELSPRCQIILQEHHERWDGSGFPSNKKGEHLDILSQCLGAASHLFEFHHGMVTGTTVPVKTILNNLKLGAATPGLEHQFGELVLSNLTHLLLLDKTKTQPKAA
jgi:response regulator RpfG family c-di-GMP phosphodiesterase